MANAMAASAKGGVALAGSRVQRRSCAARGARAAVRASATRRDVEGVAPKIAAAAAVASTMLAASPAMAATHEVAQVAAAEFMPTVLVPLTGLVFPIATMAALFIYIEQEQIS